MPQRRSWRWSRAWNTGLTLGDRRERHRLVVQVAVARGVGRDLAVAVEADLARAARQLAQGGFDLLLGALAQDQAAADARDRDREDVLLRFASGARERVQGRVRRAFDQTLEVGAHQLREMALRQVAG